MYPGHHAKHTPDKPAAIHARTGEVLTYAALDARSNQLAQLLFAQGLRRGDHVAVLLENDLRYFEVAWAAFRSGLYLTTVNRYLTGPEAGYIVADCGARALVTSRTLLPVAALIPERAPACERYLVVGGPGDGAPARFEDYDAALGAYPSAPLAEEPLGEFMLYSSGTTGKPKGVARPLSNRSVAQGLSLNVPLRTFFKMDADTVYLSPAPMYHSAPIGFCTSVQSLGGTAVMMDQFEPLAALEALARHGVTHSQWVPTMFTRLLKLPDDVRARFDLARHRVAIHGAAPCPREVKSRMMAWWGPILHEFYGGTEGNGMTYASPAEWLARPGTVGRSQLGGLHVCDEDGNEKKPGETGLVYFEQARVTFGYHGDPEKTRASQHPAHPNWATLGDVGYVDEQGYLFLTDRASFMIISGGVNIYPQEIENALVMHPKVQDVAVIGVPNDEFGEEVKAVVELVEGQVGGAPLAEELLAYARERLAPYKCPRSVDFTEQLPRLPTGKLYKHALRDRYWAGRESRIV